MCFINQETFWELVHRFEQTTKYWGKVKKLLTSRVLKCPSTLYYRWITWPLSTFPTPSGVWGCDLLWMDLPAFLLLSCVPSPGFYFTTSLKRWFAPLQIPPRKVVHIRWEATDGYENFFFPTCFLEQNSQTLAVTQYSLSVGWGRRMKST